MKTLDVSLNPKITRKMSVNMTSVFSVVVRAAHQTGLLRKVWYYWKNSKEVLIDWLIDSFIHYNNCKCPKNDKTGRNVKSKRSNSEVKPKKDDDDICGHSHWTVTQPSAVVYTTPGVVAVETADSRCSPSPWQPATSSPKKPKPLFKENVSCCCLSQFSRDSMVCLWDSSELGCF